MNIAPAPALLTIKEFAAWSRLGRTKIYELIGAEELRAIKIGRRTYIPIQAANDWLEAQPAYRDAPYRKLGPVDSARLPARRLSLIENQA